MAVVTEVAREIGPSFPAVWAQPYHLTLLAYLGLADARRIRALEDEARALRSAFRVHAAILDPKKLQADQRALEAALRGGVGETSAKPDPDALAAEMMALGARLKPPPVS